MTTFSPQAFLTNQGWEGPGSGLRKGSIKKPVTVAHKTNLKGIGKERDTGYAWWDDVFSMVANKKKGSQSPVLRKTSTGIHSPLPPGSPSVPSSQPTSGVSTPIASTSTSTSTSHFHTDIIGQAKLEAARREFYAKFLRGRPLEGTVREATEEVLVVEEEIEVSDTEEEKSTVKAEEKLTKEQKKIQKQLRKAEKEERRRLKKEKKDKKRKQKAEAEETIETTETPANEGAAEMTDSTDRKKPVKKRKRDDVKDGTSPATLTDMPSSEVSTSISGSTNAHAEKSKESKAERKARKEAKKRRRLNQAVKA